MTDSNMIAFIIRNDKKQLLTLSTKETRYGKRVLLLPCFFYDHTEEVMLACRKCCEELLGIKLLTTNEFGGCGFPGMGEETQLIEVTAYSGDLELKESAIFNSMVWLDVGKVPDKFITGPEVMAVSMLLD